MGLSERNILRMQTFCSLNPHAALHARLVPQPVAHSALPPAAFKEAARLNAAEAHAQAPRPAMPE